MTRNRPTVLILASDPAFSREITAHWPQDPAPQSNRPEFIVLDQGSSRDLKASNYDLAIADASYYERRKHNKKKDEIDPSRDKDKDKDNDKDNDKDKGNDRNGPNQLLNRSLAAGKPAILIHCDPARDFYTIHGAVIELRREPGVWPAIAGLIGREILRRRQAESHAREAERTCAAAQSEATLGRYMLEMRHNVNYALTTGLEDQKFGVAEHGGESVVDVVRIM